MPGANGTLLAGATRTERQPMNNLNVRVESDPVRNPLTQSLHRVRGAWRFYRQPNFTRKFEQMSLSIEWNSDKQFSIGGFKFSGKNGQLIGRHPAYRKSWIRQ